MRPLEILLACLSLIYLLWPAIRKQPRPKWLASLPILAGILLPLHLALEGYRWQMLPLYALTFASILSAVALLLRQRPAPNRQGSLSVICVFFSLLVWLLSASLPALLPVPVLPEPSGPFPVGSLTQVLVDPHRKELYSEQTDEPRRFMIQIWYPASPAVDAQRALWVAQPEIYAPRLASWLGLPSFSLDHLNLAHTWAYSQAPLAPDDSGSGRFPVLLFSHGWGGLSAQNTFQSEELASNGYVVVALQHTYGAVVTVFPDGLVVPLNPRALPLDASREELKTAGHQLVDQWADDLSLALDHLSELDQADPQGRFTGRLDLDRVGVFGHSTGGGAAIEFCGQDERCQAGLTMDAYMLPVSDQLLETGLSQPFFFIFSEDWPSASNNQRFGQLFSHMRDHSQVMMIAGTDHYDFSDLPYFSPLAHWIGLKGPLPADQVAAILKTYSLTFFASSLDYPSGLPANPPALDQATSAFPQAIFDWSP
jgi:predicted dienelactone hydrolase